MGRRAVLWSFVMTVSVAAQPQTTWVDPSPHMQRLVRVEPHVDIEVLDWGGPGRVLVLLAQLGQTAHIYDDWAPRLARTYHVVGITRRGFGQSSAPPDGYAMERVATDIVTVLDAQKLQRPILVGHGFAGEELSWIGARFPNRLAGLVYLDAAYDRSNVGAEAAIVRRIPPPPFSLQAFENAQSLARSMSLPEAEVRQLAQIGPDGRLMGERTPPQVPRQIIAGIVKTDYPNLRVPVLAIYAKRTSPDAQPGCRGADDAAVRQACAELHDWMTKQLSESERLFKTIPSRVQIVELPDANTFVFRSNELEVMEAIDQFVTGLDR